MSPPTPAAAGPLLSQDDPKRIATHRVVDFVESGMVLGIDTGSIAIHALENIADLLTSGRLENIVGIPHSKKAEAHAKTLGILLMDLESHPSIDLSINGTDEVNPFLNLVKGRGGSHLREKMIEGASKRFLVIVDESKWVEKLGGSKMAVPVEVIPFGWKYTLTRLKKIFVTDNLNYRYFDNVIEGDLDEISDEILKMVGVVEHGMFLGMAIKVIIAGKDGIVMQTKPEIFVGQRR